MKKLRAVTPPPTQIDLVLIGSVVFLPIAKCWLCHWKKPSKKYNLPLKALYWDLEATYFQK